MVEEAPDKGKRKRKGRKPPQETPPAQQGLPPPEETPLPDVPKPAIRVAVENPEAIRAQVRDFMEKRKAQFIPLDTTRLGGLFLLAQTDLWSGSGSPLTTHFHLEPDIASKRPDRGYYNQKRTGRLIEILGEKGYFVRPAQKKIAHGGKHNVLGFYRHNIVFEIDLGFDNYEAEQEYIRQEMAEQQQGGRFLVDGKTLAETELARQKSCMLIRLDAISPLPVNDEGEFKHHMNSYAKVLQDVTGTIHQEAGIAIPSKGIDMVLSAPPKKTPAKVEVLP